IQRSLTLKALDPLVKKDADPIAKVWAHMAMMSYTGKVAEGGLEHITSLLKTGDTVARIHAAEALLNLGPVAKEAIPALAGALGDKDTTVVGLSLLSLGRMDSVRALTALETFAADKDKPETFRKVARDGVEQVKKNMAGSSR